MVNVPLDATYSRQPANILQGLQAINNYSDVNSNFGADVDFLYKGLVSGGSFDASINTTSQYATFHTNLQKYVSCFGGDSSMAAKINSDPEGDDSFRNYQAWVNTTLLNPVVMSFSTMSVWSVMSSANDSNLNARSDDFEKAYD